MMTEASDTKSGRFQLAGKYFFLRLTVLFLLALLACAATATPTPDFTATPTLEPTATPEPRPTTMPEVEGGQAQIGVRYSHRLFTHCGIQYTNFDGRKWVADPIVKLFGGPDPPYGWKNPYDTGTIELVAKDRALFLSDSGEGAFFIDPPEDYDFKLCI
jgi:hypothetical protein